VTVLSAGVAAAAGDPTGLQLQTAGGRVLGVTGIGPTILAARERAYAGVEAVAWPGCRYRADIAAGA
ncbi:MAG: phosphoribosylglycinamide synthetase C domain-containing protein, partial [Acidimicrobiales bacterium]